MSVAVEYQQPPPLPLSSQPPSKSSCFSIESLVSKDNSHHNSTNNHHNNNRHNHHQISPHHHPAIITSSSAASSPSSTPASSPAEHLQSTSPFSPLPPMNKIFKPTPTDSPFIGSLHGFNAKTLYSPEPTYPDSAHAAAAAAAAHGLAMPQHMNPLAAHHAALAASHGPAAMHAAAGLFGPPPPRREPFGLYPWFLARNRLLGHRGFPGAELPNGGFFLQHPFRKPKRIRTAFSPSQLLRLEQAFEKNHYVVGAERKSLAASLNLTETQVKVWFQNRRTKYKRIKSEEEGEAEPKKKGSHHVNRWRAETQQDILDREEESS